MAYKSDVTAFAGGEGYAPEPAPAEAPGFAGLDGSGDDIALASGEMGAKFKGEMAPEATGDVAKTDGQGSSEVPTAKNTPRLIIYQAELGIFVFEVDASIAKAVAASQKYGGWVQRSTTESLQIRVPVANFEALVGDLLALGDVNFKNIVGTDVTEEFFDLQIRMRNAEALRERFLVLLAQAKTVKDSLMIETELSRITGQIEQFKGRIKYLKDHGMFSTINIRFDKKPDQPVRSRVTLPFYWIQSYSLENIF